MNELANVLAGAIAGLKQSGSDYTAKVTRVEGQTAYVQFTGSDIADTPVAMSISCRKGDMVRVRVADGKAWITGNDTSPPTDNKDLQNQVEQTTQSLNRRVANSEGKYSEIRQSVDEIVLEVGDAQAAADAAQSTANGRMTTNMSNRASSITIGSGTMTFNSNSLVINSSKFKLDASGNATFSGALSAATGSFAGSLNAATGSFAGSLSAASGTFAGSLSAAGGTFNGNITFVNRGQGRADSVKIGPGTGTPYDTAISIGGTNTQALMCSAYISINDYSAGGDETYITKTEMHVSDGAETSGIRASGYYHSSDRRIKTDIKTADPNLAKRLKPVRFRFKTSGRVQYGFIAQDVQEVIPEAVSEDDNGYLNLNYTALIAPILALVQEQENRITALEKELRELKEKLNGNDTII